MTKFDAAGDGSYAQLATLVDQFGALPDYVKAASVAEVVEPGELVSSAYADPVSRSFPIHTKAATYLSTLYFLGNLSQLKPLDVTRISTRLEKAAADHGILNEIADLVQKAAASYQPPAETEPVPYALEKRSAGGTEQRYPLRNATETKIAAEWFAQYREHFRFDERQQIADRILDKAAEYGVDFPEELDYLLAKQAGRGICDRARTIEQLRYRSQLPGVAAPLREGLAKLAQDLTTSPGLVADPATTLNLARTLDTFDREHKVAYRGLLTRPEDCLFAGSLKHAEAFMLETCPTLTGAIYDKQQLAKLSMADISELWGEEAARSVQDTFGVNTDKLAELVSTLPLPDAVELDRLMAARQQAPVYVNKTALELSPADRLAAARAYRPLAASA